MHKQHAALYARVATPERPTYKALFSTTWNEVGLQSPMDTINNSTQKCVAHHTASTAYHFIQGADKMKRCLQNATQQRPNTMQHYVALYNTIYNII